MVTKIREELWSKSRKMILCGFGAGLSWGAVYLETENVKVLPLIEY